MTRGWAAAGALAVLCVSASARADDPVPAVGAQPSFTIERLTPASGTSLFYQVEDAEILPRGGQAFGATLSTIFQPLVVYAITDARPIREGEILSEPVAWRSTLDLSVARGVGRRLQLALGLPVVVAQGGDRLQGLGLGGEAERSSLATTTIGDLRVGGKLRVVGVPGGIGTAVAMGVIVTLPTGDEDAFAGEAGAVIEIRLAASTRQQRWAVGANLGARLRTEEARFIDPTLAFGNELVGGVGVTAEVPETRRRLWAVGELAAVWGVDEDGSRRGPDPLEVRFGARWAATSAWGVGAGVGLGLGDREAIGAPPWRLIAEVRYVPGTRVDSDADGLDDVADRCPRDAEDRDAFEDADGCPELDDDGDDVPDLVDACPLAAEDLDGTDDDDGCPDRDDDGDGIPDTSDRCRRLPEDLDGVDDADGCPDDDDPWSQPTSQPSSAPTTQPSTRPSIL